MSWGNRACVSCAAAFLVPVLGVTASATAKLPPISGKLSKPGYTVIALAANGQARSVAATRGKFRLRSSAKTMTLQLRAPDGVYGGPIVVGTQKKGKQALLGVKAGAKLGKVELRAGKGYAKLKRELAKKWLDVKLAATAKKGAPIGAGNFGLVRVKKLKGPGSDPDLDGIPNSLDIDDDGDLILDKYDSSTATPVSRVSLRSASPSASRPPFFSLTTQLWMAGPEAVNVNAGSSDQQIAEAQPDKTTVGVLWGGVDPGSAQLNCGALIYCSAGGTGRYMPIGGIQFGDSPPFPACCDPDGNGFGSMIDTQPSQAASDFHGMNLWAGATADQLSAGDVLIERATVDGAPVELAQSMGFIFSTWPVLAAYDDGQGDSGTFSYPQANRLVPVRAGPSGDVVVRLIFWRPQRRRIAGEPGEGEWMDVGHLDYTATAVNFPGTPAPCPLSSYSNIDPNLNLTPQTPSNTIPSSADSYLEDLQGDQPSSPANTFSYTLNFTNCLASHGLSMSTTQATNFAFTAYAVPTLSPTPSLSTAAFGLNFQLQP